MKSKSSTVLLISASDFDNDSRLKRIQERISRSGLQVLTVAYGVKSKHSEIHLSPVPTRSLLARLIDVAKMIGSRLLPEQQFLKMLSKRLITKNLSGDCFEVVSQSSIDLVVVKHWTSLPIALGLQGSPKIWLDINEVFEAEHDNSKLWQLIYKPVIIRLLKIAKHRIVLRSATSADQIKFMGDESVLHLPNTKKPILKFENNRLKSKPIRLLYHGLITTNRSLETALHGPNRADMHLTIRGHGKPKYINSLKAITVQLGLEAQVTFEPSIANTELIETASKHDLGLCLFANKSAQLMLAEPNKIYEYMAAGLGIIASRTPTMERMIEDKKIGKLSPIGLNQVVSVSEIFSKLTIEQINKWKEKSHKEATSTWKNDYDWHKLDLFLHKSNKNNNS